MGDHPSKRFFAAGNGQKKVKGQELGEMVSQSTGKQTPGDAQGAAKRDQQGEKVSSWGEGVKPGGLSGAQPLFDYFRSPSQGGGATLTRRS